MSVDSVTLRPYEPGFDAGHVRIGREVARDWVWPYAYDELSLARLHGSPDFDPALHLYAFEADEMVGCITSSAKEDAGGAVSAWLDFPRVLPGHRGVRRELTDRALEALVSRGARRIQGRVTTMCPNDARLAEQAGFTISDWGYKVYYTYEMGWGPLGASSMGAEEIDPLTDLDACAELATNWYGRPAEWCRDCLAEWHAEGVITHAGVRDSGRLVASCLAAANEVRPSTAAMYCVYSPGDKHLEPLLAHVVSRCIAQGTHNLIADLVNEHRGFESVYQRLGFVKVADWARCDLVLS